jgi:ferredoxin--NADP+ reductase/benzoate/toluate 1,2-dioxygenase reductase subunit
MIDRNKMKLKKSVHVLGIRNVNDSTYVLKFDRNNREFIPGQHVILGIMGENNAREYSVYSGEQDDFFEILVKEVKEGDVSKRLKLLKPGVELEMNGPLGFFTLDNKSIASKKHVFIATGTGIAPFRSFVKSYPDLDYNILHGVRYGSEAYDHDVYDPKRIKLCTSGDRSGDFKGRVTDLLRQSKVDTNAEYYLCGNVNMIHDAFDILKEKGVPADQMHAEVYF